MNDPNHDCDVGVTRHCTHDGTAHGAMRLRAGWLELLIECETCGKTLSDVTLVQHTIRPEGV